MPFTVARSVVWCAGLVLVATGVTAVAQSGQAGPPPAAAQASAPTAATPPTPPPLTPVQIANNAERQRIMDQLKISAIPPGAVSSSPATYNEAEANPYPNLPDPLTLKNGQKVTTAAVWKNRRRAEASPARPGRISLSATRRFRLSSSAS